VNLVDDLGPEGGDLHWGYESIDEAFLAFDAAKAFNIGYFDELELKYGRIKYVLGYEAWESSKNIMTVERSAISNKVYQSARPTGFQVDAVKGDWNYSAGIFSSTTQGDVDKEFSGWQDGVIYWLHAGYKANDQWSFGTDFTYNDVDAGDDDQLGYEWAGALYTHYNQGRFGVHGDLIIGDNGDNHSNPERRGNFYGIVVMPYYWIIEDKLQAVVQLEHMASSEAQGVRINSRYGRRDHSAAVNSGRGDNHQSIYAGLNYHLCDHNAKIMGGVEWQQMDTPAGDFDTLTYVVAFRSFF